MKHSSLIVILQEQWLEYLLAMVEDDSAVGPTVMVDQTQVGEKTHTNSLQASLVTQCESITLDLQRQTEEGERGM